MAHIKNKITKIGNSYAILIPKALVNCGILEEGPEYLFELKGKVLKKDKDSKDLSGIEVDPVV